MDGCREHSDFFPPSTQSPRKMLRDKKYCPHCGNQGSSALSLNGLFGVPVVAQSPPLAQQGTWHSPGRRATPRQALPPSMGPALPGCLLLCLPEMPPCKACWLGPPYVTMACRKGQAEEEAWAGPSRKRPLQASSYPSLRRPSLGSSGAFAAFCQLLILPANPSPQTRKTL